jgi:hypothetical protein
MRNNEIWTIIVAAAIAYLLLQTLKGRVRNKYVVAGLAGAGGHIAATAIVR